MVKPRYVLPYFDLLVVESHLTPFSVFLPTIFFVHLLQLKNVYLRAKKDDDLMDPPSLELIHKACLFDIDPAKQEEMGAMIFVWNCAAPAVLGCHSWGEKTHQSNIMWEHKVNHPWANQDQFTPQALALVYVQCVNGWEKWDLIAEHLKKNPKCTCFFAQRICGVCFNSLT